MKGLAVLFGLAVVVVAAFVIFQGNMNADDQRMITIAMGNNDGKVSDLHLVVAPLMVQDPPKTLPSGTELWDEWLEEHFVLTSDSGDKVKFERMAGSNLISDRDAGGSPEFFIKGKVKPGSVYTFEFIPVNENPERFRYEFTAEKEMPLTRVNFKRVSK